MKPLFWWHQRDDGQPGDEPERTLHCEGTSDEFVRIEVPVTVPWYRARKVRLVARAYQHTGELTLSAESIRVESGGRRGDK